MTFEIPEQLNIADAFLDARVREGAGDRVALLCDERELTYRDVQRLANRYANALEQLGAEPEQRIVVALQDGPDFVGALFGVLKLGAAVVMVNPALKPDEIRYFLEYTRARFAIVDGGGLEAFSEAAQGVRHLRQLLVVGADPGGHADFDPNTSDTRETEPTHRDDVALWLFSGGTTGRPKAVLQSHGSFLNTTELYAKRTLGYSAADRTLSVPKLYFGYATGSGLFFPFYVGGSVVLFPERPTAELLFELIGRHSPTILINVPTMVNQMVSHEAAAAQDLSSLRFATSAGEALPPKLYDRWKKSFGVELLDGLGTAEMWHIFITNRPGHVRPGTLGQAVEGFDVKLADEHGHPVADGEIGTLWVRGRSRAIGYWQQMERTMDAFLGEWYRSSDLLSRDTDGYFTYSGRSDDMLKVGGKWVAPQQVESCLLEHPQVKECAVVGVTDAAGLVKPCAFVVARETSAELSDELKAFVRDRLEPYKYPREVIFLDELPRTHLGKVDRGKLQQS